MEFDSNTWYQLTEQRVGFGSGMYTGGGGSLGFAAFNSSSQNQYWQIIPTGSGNYFRNAAVGPSQALGTCFDINEADPDHTQPCFQSLSGQNNNLEWQVQQWGDGTFYLTNNANGTGLHLNVHPGTPVYMSSNNTEPAADSDSGQHWEFSSISPIDNDSFSTTFAAPSSTSTASSSTATTTDSSTSASASTSASGSQAASTLASGSQTASASTLISTSTTTATPTAVAASSPSSTSPGLSTGAIAGIGVAFGLLVGVILAGLAFFFIRRRRSSSQLRRQSLRLSSSHGPWAAPTISTRRSSMWGDASAAAQQDRKFYQMEMPRSARDVKELPPQTAPAELEGAARFELTTLQQKSPSSTRWR